MARSSGTYSAPVGSWNPAVEGASIDEADWNTLLDDIEAALTESVYTGGLGSTDNRLIRTDGSDAKKVQSTGVTVDDSNNLSGVAQLSASTMSLGSPGRGISSSIGLSTLPAFLATKSANQTGVADATFTQITFDQESFDVGSYFASNTWTPPAGRVLIAGYSQLGGTVSTGLGVVRIMRDGVAIAASQHTAVAALNGVALWVHVLATANGSNAFTMQGYLDVDSGTVTVFSSTNTVFFGIWLGA